MNIVWLKSEPQLWTVGYYQPDGKWFPMEDCGSEHEASRRVAFLNGASEDVLSDAKTLRDEFAMRAPFPAPGLAQAFDEAARLRFKWADAMLKAREQQS